MAARRSIPGWALLVLCQPGLAGEPSVTAFGSVTSNATYRAYSKSENGPTFQLNADALFTDSGVIIGAWLSRVRFGGANVEFNPYLGKRWSLGEDFRLDAVLSGYVYDRRVFASEAHYGEAQLLLHFRDLLSLRTAVAPDAYGLDAATANVQLDLRFPLLAEVDLGAGVGYDRARAALEYDDAYWNMGLSWFPSRRIAVDLRYHDALLFNEADTHSGRPAMQAFFDSIELSPTAVLTLTIGF
jgi:uncharacterized protein (TIGR02001 family)